MSHLFTESNYVAAPHGAVGYLGLKKYQELHPDTQGIFLETAHPVKFLDVVKETLGIDVAIPPQIEKVLHKTKHSIKIATYHELKSYLLER